MFQSLRLRRAAKHYARHLPGALRQGYGATEFYTAQQIEAAVKKAQLPMQYIAIGYAAFLPEDAFRGLGLDGDYQMLRALLQRHISSSPAYGIEPLDRSYPGAISGGFC